MRDWKSVVRDRIALLHLDGAAELDVAQELAQHLEDRYCELLSGGATEEEAYQQATGELDNLYPVRKEFRRRRSPSVIGGATPGAVRAGNFIEDAWKDICYAGRTMRKSPLFVLFVVLTVGLGIGANTTVFTVINTLILNPLPVPKSDELIAVALTETKNTSKANVTLAISHADLKEYRAKNEVFSSLAGYTGPHTVTLETNGVSERLFSEIVTGNYFSTLGIKPAAGRFFQPEEDSTPAEHAVAVMNYATWQGRFGGASDIIGKTLRLNNLTFTVIGVAPPRFIGVNGIFGPDLWIPAAMMEQLLPNELQNALKDRSRAIFLGIARLKPGVNRAKAEANLANMASALAGEYPEVDAGHTAIVRPVIDVLFGSSAGGSTPILLGSAVLLVVVGIVLLIACSNVANLLLARSAARQQEVAVRLAIGASRGRLVRQLLTESILLGCLSGVVGLVMGYAGLRGLWSSLPSSSNFIAPNLNATVFIFTLVVSLLTGVVFGTIPALRASYTTVAEALKEEARTVGKSRRKITIANTLLTGQVAFSFLLLVAAALFLRSIERAYKMDPGFQSKHLAVFLTNPGQAGYGRPQVKAIYKNIRDRVATIPGIESVSWASNLPLWGRVVSGMRVEGRQQRSKADVITTIVNTVDRNYFETAGVTIEAGREFTATDRENSTPVAIINEKMAHDYWPDKNVLGKRIQLPDEKLMRQVVGIARNANYSTLAEPPQLCVYRPMEQSYSDAMTLYVRTAGDPAKILTAVQREVRSAGPRLFVNDLRTGKQIIDGGLFQARVGVLLLSVFGLLALGLASIGLYGIMAYSVNQRRREIGMRMALGAPRGSVLRLILKQGMKMVGVGVLIGSAAAIAMGRLLSRMLYGVSPGDPASMAGAAFVLVAVALLASYLPARGASRVDPLMALREA